MATLRARRAVMLALLCGSVLGQPAGTKIPPGAKILEDDDGRLYYYDGPMRYYLPEKAKPKKKWTVDDLGKQVPLLESDRSKPDYIPEDPDDPWKPNIFEVNGEMLKLPPVLPSIDFTQNNKLGHSKALAGATEKLQKEIRDQRHWGRLYIEGWPDHIQYFRAEFGTAPPVGTMPFMLADPIDACGDELRNGDEIRERGAVVLAYRGTCTFGTKAKLVKNYTDSGLVIMNNEPGLFHLPGPDASELELFVGLISNSTGHRLMSYVEEAGAGASPMQVNVVPIYCSPKKMKSHLGLDSGCFPATKLEEEHVETKLSDGGDMALTIGGKTEEIGEFLVGGYGTMPAPRAYELVRPTPASGCAVPENAADLAGKVAVVDRGECGFFDKTIVLENSGVAGVVIVNHDDGSLLRPAAPQGEGSEVTAFTISVTKSTGAKLLAAIDAGGATAAFTTTPGKGAGVWQDIASLFDVSKWPKSEVGARTRLDEELAKEGVKGYAVRP
uniref:PA domain-containing protein n=3 Tax=Phaeomonas parva TaxID=124430 RepID=A0A7S1TVA7_9STRA|mmetsp:Transcript_19539/g.59118  ORF Transcript_19539/g.59118 Transcript_19539/m.59118 type:complete len:498 (+) Transcript_19539:163-1656(+)